MAGASPWLNVFDTLIHGCRRIVGKLVVLDDKLLYHICSKVRDQHRIIAAPNSIVGMALLLAIFVGSPA